MRQIKVDATLQAEVLDFVEYISSKNVMSKHTQDKTDWSVFSLSHAMRGMENEQTVYSLKDLKYKRIVS